MSLTSVTKRKVYVTIKTRFKSTDIERDVAESEWRQTEESLPRILRQSYFDIRWKKAVQGETGTQSHFIFFVT